LGVLSQPWRTRQVQIQNASYGRAIETLDRSSRAFEWNEQSAVKLSANGQTGAEVTFHEQHCPLKAKVESQETA
jgi:hypothetical protein